MLRVTSNMMSSQLMLNLNRNASRMNETQLQASTGRKLNKPSDDPVGITYSLRYRGELSSNEQYQKNVDSAVSWLDFSDSTMNQAGEVLNRLKSLVVQASSETNEQSGLDSINQEVIQLKQQLVDIANSKLNGKYVFNGQQYDKMPYNFPKNPDGSLDTTTAATITTDQGSVEYLVGESVKIGINVTGNDVFGSGNDNVFAMMDRISQALKDGKHDDVSTELTNIESSTNRLLSMRAEVGAKTNRIELMESRLGDLELNLTDLQSKTEDADYGELIMRSKIQENIYNASLSAGAKIIQPTLVDFLR
ncbi:flagellar hook-associated protein FlgL [Paenibacillus sp. EC2-1]|uniref:flagellar hook-associated protein FlgL n=1 Tax=Paenibacillus sp. EC2-1 TaxID=3388665 RepID=UPI003BEF1730